MSDTENETAAAAAEAPDDGCRTVEEWRKAKGTSPWAFAAAKQHAGWPIGQRVTEGAYDAAVKAAVGTPLSSPSIPTRKVS